MRLTAGLDSGPVCAQVGLPIEPEDTYGTLAARLETLGGNLLVQALDERPPCAEQDDPGDQVAERLLRREAEDDGRERRADRDRRKRDVGDPQREHDRREHGEQPDEESGCAGSGRVHALEEDRFDPANEIAGQRPADDHERQHHEHLQCRRPRRHRTGVVCGRGLCGLYGRTGVEPEQVGLVVPDQDHAGEQRREHQQL